MSFFGALKREIFERRGSPSPSDDYWYNPFGWKSSAGADVNEQSSMKLVAVWACVRLLSNALASTPAILYRRLDNGKERERADPLYSLFRTKFNGELTAFRGLQTMQAHILTHGNAYAFQEQSKANGLKALHPITPDRVEPKRANPGDLVGTLNRRALPRELVYRISTTNGPKLYGREEIFHVPGFGFDGVKGYNPIEFAIEALGLGLATQQSGAQFFKNHAVPGGILEYPAKLKPESVENFKKEVRAAYGGLGNQHQVMVLEEGLKFHQTTIPPETSQYIETRIFSVTEIARFFGVQPHLIAELTRSTNNNIEHQGLEFLQHTMLPWFTLWEQEINAQLIPEGRPLFVEFLAENILRMDSTGQAALFTALFNLASITSNQIRAKLNMNPYEGGDVYYHQLNMQPVGAPPPERPAVARSAESLAKALIKRGEYRAASKRRGLQTRFSPLLLTAYTKLVNSELREIRKAVESILGRRDIPDFRTWLRRFYEGHGDVAEKILLPVYLAYVAALRAEALTEVDFEPEIGDTFEDDFPRGYLGNWIIVYLGGSRRQLEALLDDAADTEAAIEAITGRLDEWAEKRAGKVADDEVVKVDGIVTRATYREAGVTRLVWRANGSENCPYCTELDGRVVGIDAPFVDKDEDFQPEGAERPLGSKKNVLNPPLHGGCDCQIEPG